MALIQLFVEKQRDKNLVTASKLIREAARNGAKIVALPEYFTCWMDPKYFVENKETQAGPTPKMLTKAARDNNVYLFGGTFPEAITGSEMLNNTCNIYNPRGDLVNQFRKLHLFDVDLGERMKICESDCNKHGEGLTVIDTEYCKVGFGVCLDLRYPELARLYGQKGCQLLTYMGGFSTTTGPVHLEVLQRARAVDNQVYVANVGPASSPDSPYVTYGHSAFVDPWGEVIAKTGSEEDIIYADIDMDYVSEIRRRMPLDSIRRDDLFKTVDLKEEGTPV